MILSSIPGNLNRFVMQVFGVEQLCVKMFPNMKV